MIAHETQQEFVELLLAGNTVALNDLVAKLVSSGLQVKEIYISLFQYALYQVGTLWENNRISVAAEHMATLLVLSLFHHVYPQLFSTARRNKSVLVVCTPGESHYIGARMVADIAEMHGWDSFFIGGDVPLPDILAMIKKHDPDLMAVSMTIYSNLPSMLGLLARTRAAYPALPIVVGGQGFTVGDTDAIAQYDGITYCNSLARYESILDKHD